MKSVVGTPVPDIVWDGVANKEKVVDGVATKNSGISIHDNRKGAGDVTFANLGGLATLADPGKGEIRRDLAAHAQPFPPVEPVVIPGVQ